jgi:hypothetical protein
MAKDEERETHVLYVDDSGTKEYAPSGGYGSGNTRYFVFGGPFLTVEQAKGLTAQIRHLKEETFRTSKVKIKSNWLRLENERTSRYLRRFGLSDARLTSFVQQYYQAILDGELTP